MNFTFDILEVENITYNNWGYSAHHQMPVEITAVVTEALTGMQFYMGFSLRQVWGTFGL